MIPFDPYDLDLEIMPPAYACGAFTCGDPSIDAALRTDLMTAIKEGRNKGYFLEWHGQLVAFTSLKAATFELDSVDRENHILSSRSVPGIRVELFAVAWQYQGSNVGRRLMEEVTAIAREASQLVGARFLAVESVPEAQKFYERMGFVPTVPRPDGDTVFMLLDLK